MPDPELEDRPSLLDAFAAAAPDVPPPALIQNAGAVALPPARAMGALKLDVKRDERAVLQKIKTLAAAAGDDWYYRWPVKNRKTNKTEWVEGPSIKLANEVARLFGNDEVETRVLDLGDSWLIYARFTDYETGFNMTRPFQQRKGQRTFTEKSADDADRSRDIAFQIGVSKAIRNVVVNALQTFADFALDEARGALVGKIGRDLERWRGVTLKRLEERGVELKRVEAVMGRVASEWLAPDIAQVIAMMKSVLDGMATIDETFPPLAAQAAAEGPASQLDQFANEGDSDAAGGRPSNETQEGAETHPNRPPGSKV